MSKETFIWAHNALGRRKGQEEELSPETHPDLETWKAAHLVVRKGEPMPEPHAKTAADEPTMNPGNKRRGIPRPLKVDPPAPAAVAAPKEIKP
jgi:hypothetical protein